MKAEYSIARLYHEARILPSFGGILAFLFFPLFSERLLLVEKFFDLPILT